MPFAIPAALKAALAFARSPAGRFLGLALLILAVAGGVYLKGRSDEAEKWRPKLADARVQLDRCQDNRKALDDARKLQNKAVEDMRQEGQRLADATGEAVRRAEKAKAASDARAGRLEALSRTFGKGNACAEVEAADAAILKELGR